MSFGTPKWERQTQPWKQLVGCTTSESGIERDDRKTEGSLFLIKSNPWVLEPIKRMEIILAIGEQDPFLDDNRLLSARLWDKGAWNALHVWGGRAHRPREWREMARLYL
jgi:hypothetical protein